MLKIDRLVLRLPDELGPRARRIVSLLAEELAAELPAEAARLDRLVLPPIEVSPSMSDARIAIRIARSIRARIDPTP